MSGGPREADTELVEQRRPEHRVQPAGAVLHPADARVREADVIRRAGALERAEHVGVLDEVAIEERPFVAEGLVEPAHVLVVVVLAFRRRHVIVVPRRDARNVRQRHQRQQLRRRRTDPALGNLVARERQAGPGIDQRFREKAEVARALPRVRDDGLAREAAIFAVPFVRPEHECPVANDRCAQGSAELVELQRRRLGGREIILGLEFVAPCELPAGAAQAVRPGFRDDVHHRSGVAPELGREVARLDLEFLHRVHVGPRLQRVPFE